LVELNIFCAKSKRYKTNQCCLASTIFSAKNIETMMKVKINYRCSMSQNYQPIEPPRVLWRPFGLSAGR